MSEGEIDSDSDSSIDVDIESLGELVCVGLAVALMVRVDDLVLGGVFEAESLNDGETDRDGVSVDVLVPDVLMDDVPLSL